MARIKTFRCSGNRCRFIVRIAEEFPVWHPQTPVHLKKLPVPAESLAFVVGYRRELLCRYCKKAVDATEDLTCPQCTRSGIYTDEAGRMCPQCVVGTLVLEHQSNL